MKDTVLFFHKNITKYFLQTTVRHDFVYEWMRCLAFLHCLVTRATQWLWLAGLFRSEGRNCYPMVSDRRKIKDYH